MDGIVLATWIDGIFARSFVILFNIQPNGIGLSMCLMAVRKKGECECGACMLRLKCCIRRSSAKAYGILSEKLILIFINRLILGDISNLHIRMNC